MSSDHLPIFNENHKEKLLFSGCDEWMKIGSSRSCEKRDLFSFIAS
jgi:hypothetical protein